MKVRKGEYERRLELQRKIRSLIDSLNLFPARYGFQYSIDEAPDVLFKEIGSLENSWFDTEGATDPDVINHYLQAVKVEKKFRRMKLVTNKKFVQLETDYIVKKLIVVLNQVGTVIDRKASGKLGQLASISLDQSGFWKDALVSVRVLTLKNEGVATGKEIVFQTPFAEVSEAMNSWFEAYFGDLCDSSEWMTTLDLAGLIRDLVVVKLMDTAGFTREVTSHTACSGHVVPCEIRYTKGAITLTDSGKAIIA